MPAIIRHWISARPVMLAGIATGAVISPPMLVTNPWAPASRTLFSITSWIARSTSPFCSRSCLSAALAAGGSGPTPSIARWSDSRTKCVVSPGASSAMRGASCLLTVLVTPMPPTVRIRWSRRSPHTCLGDRHEAR